MVSNISVLQNYYVLKERLYPVELSYCQKYKDRCSPLGLKFPPGQGN